MGHSPPSAAGEGHNVVAIVDSSGSMWGQIDGISKSVIVREALADFAALLPPASRLGVLTYGHSEQQSCTRVDVVVPVSRPDPGTTLKALSRIRPRGRTPIATALEHAAKALDYKNAGAAIVLLADGYENCRRDPCAVAKALRDSGKNLTIHVIGINLSDKDRIRLQCVAKNANGVFANAHEKLELAASLNAVLIALQQGSAWVSAAPPANKKPRARPRIKQGLHLTAVLKRAGAPVKSGVIWRVFAAQPDAGGARKEIRRETAASPVIDLPPGHYFVDASYGLARSAQELTVNSGKTTQATFVLDAGTIRLAAVMNDEQAPLNRVLYQLFDIGHGAKPERKAISRSADGTVVFHVPSGSYNVTAEQDYARVEQPVSVEPGAISEHTLVMNIGALELKATAAPGGEPLKRMVYRIHRISDRTRKVEDEIARTAADHPQFRLPSGEYLVHARHGLAEVSQRVTVNPGRLTRKTINMNTGSLRISSKFAGPTGKLKDYVSYKIFRDVPEPGGARAEVARTALTGKTFNLPAGSYTVTGRLGNVNATVEAKVAVEAGRQTAVEMEHKAALVSFTFTNKPGGQPAQNVFWMLLDGNGQELWRTSRPTPRFALAGGRYQAVAEISGRRLKKGFSVAAGEEKRIAFGGE